MLISFLSPLNVIWRIVESMATQLAGSIAYFVAILVMTRDYITTGSRTLNLKQFLNGQGIDGSQSFPKSIFSEAQSLYIAYL